MTRLVVGRDGDINKFQRCVGVTKRDDGNVDVGGFLDRLVIHARVSDNDNAGLLERARDVVESCPA